MIIIIVVVNLNITIMIQYKKTRTIQERVLLCYHWSEIIRSLFYYLITSVVCTNSSNDGFRESSACFSTGAYQDRFFSGQDPFAVRAYGLSVFLQA